MGYGYVLSNVLAQGSRPPVGAPLRPEFTTLVLCAYELIGSEQASPHAFPDVTVIKVPLDDAKPSKAEVHRAFVAAFQIADRIRHGERVLVTCNQGRNRSGLIVALTLMQLGLSAEQAIQRVRRARTNALTNPYFVQVLRAYDRMPRLSSASLST